jgi:hypothetical protein
MLAPSAPALFVGACTLYILQLFVGAGTTLVRFKTACEDLISTLPKER